MSPDPKHWPVLVTKIKNMGNNFKGYSAAEVKSIKAPVFCTKITGYEKDVNNEIKEKSQRFRLFR